VFFVIILGIDPGYAIVGIGVLEYKGNSFRPIEYNAITTHSSEMTSLRLKRIKEDIQEYLHKYKQYILGRMGIPYKERKISVISVVLDAPEDKISALSGQLGRLSGVSTKTVYSHKLFESFDFEGEYNE
jgi:putative iron-only hydrogenase system regulator